MSKHVTHDKEHGFDLLEKGKLGTPVGVDVDGQVQMLPAIGRYGHNNDEIGYERVD